MSGKWRPFCLGLNATNINETSIDIRVWIGDYIHMKVCNVITNPRPHFNSGLDKSPSKLCVEKGIYVQKTINTITY